MPSKQAVDYCADYLTQVVQYVTQVTLPRQYGKQFLQNQQISYVITVPAIWSDKAKELTRQVIYPRRPLVFVFSLFCLFAIGSLRIPLPELYNPSRYFNSPAFVFRLSRPYLRFPLPSAFPFPFPPFLRFGNNFRLLFAQGSPAGNSC